MFLNKCNIVGFEVLTAVVKKMYIFWNFMALYPRRYNSSNAA
jgi:hypothetical protein